MPVARSDSTAKIAAVATVATSAAGIASQMTVAGGEQQRRGVARHAEQPGVPERDEAARSRRAR